MTAKDIILAVLKEKKVTQTRLAEMLGYKSQSGVTTLLRGSILCDNLIRIMDQLDYEIIVQPKTQGKRREGSMVLEPSGLPDGRSKK